MPAEKIKMKHIEFLWVEGDQTWLRRGLITRWDDANHCIYWLRSKAPKKGQGYNKLKFRVTWEDGSQWEGRMDLQNTDYTGDADVTLDRHIADFWEAYSGLYKPAHLTDAQYTEMLRVTKCQDQMKNWLEHYALDSFSLREDRKRIPAHLQ